MKRTRLKRHTALKGASAKSRAPMVVTFAAQPFAARPKREWDSALAKVAAEGRCRACRRSGVKLDAAHIIARSQVAPGPGEHPDNIVPLCQVCHAAQHNHALELLPLLTLSEQSYIAGLVGIARAYRFTTHRNEAALAGAGINDTGGAANA